METYTTETNKIDEIFQEIGIPAELRTPILVATAIIPVVAGVLYIKDRHKILNADTRSAFMSMGNGNF